MMHVCVDARLLNGSGIGTLLKAALSALIEAHKFEITLLCKREEIDIAARFSTNLIPLDSKIYSLQEQRELAAKIPKCDLFWSPHFNVPLLPIKAKKRVVTVCDVYHLAQSSLLPLAQKIYAQIFYNAAFLLSHTVMTISQFSKEEIVKFSIVKPKRLEIVTPALAFEPPALSPGKRDILLCVGNVKPHKNLRRLLRAYAIAKPLFPLYIVGKKEDLITCDRALFADVEKSDYLKQQVIFTGFIQEEELKALYAKALLFIFPSTYEGFGYPPLEAMACGCPVIASRAGAIPEVCGDAVEYIDPYSDQSIVEAIKNLLNNSARREDLIQKGRELALRKRKEKNRIVEVIDACCNSA